MLEATFSSVLVKDDGSERKVTEKYIIENALSFTDAENILLSLFGNNDDFEILSIKKSKVREIVNRRQSDDDLIWLAEMMDVFLTDEGEEKQMKYKVLVFAKTFDSAKAIMSDYMKQGFDMSLISLKVTGFLDVLV